LALASSLRDRPVEPGTVAAGEVGLLGELRVVGGLERRLREATRLGFRRAIVPAGRARLPAIPGLDVIAVATLRDAIRAALSTGPGSAAGSPDDGPPTAESGLPERAGGGSPVLG
jgi:DNA repair protein RadA/Sms